MNDAFAILDKRTAWHRVWYSPKRGDIFLRCGRIIKHSKAVVCKQYYLGDRNTLCKTCFARELPDA